MEAATEQMMLGYGRLVIAVTATIILHSALANAKSGGSGGSDQSKSGVSTSAATKKPITIKPKWNRVQEQIDKHN
jgi:hypothetical protein